MTAEEIQNIIQALKNTVDSFAAQLEAVATGIPNAREQPTVIKLDQQADNNELTARINNDVTPGDVKFIDALHEKFKPLFDELSPKSSTSPFDDEGDVADVLSGEEAEKITKVSIVSISEDALEGLKDAIGVKSETSAAGGGFLSSILGLLGGAGATAIGGGLVSILTALPAALPGILVAIGAIIGVTAALSASVAIVVKTLSFLKDDIMSLFPVIEKFAEVFTNVAVAVVPVISKALTDFTATVLPALMNAFTTFASVVIPAIIGAISDLVSSPGFRFIAGAFFTIISQTIDGITKILTATGDVLKTISTDVKDILVGLFENAKAIIIPVVSDIKEMFINIVEPIANVFNGLFENIRTTLVPISEDVKQTLVAIGKQVQDTVLGALDKIDAVFTKVPLVIGSILNKIRDFSNEIQVGKVGTIAGEVSALAGALIKMTGTGLLSGLAEFFTKSPFDKIIDFQNKIDKEKLDVLSTLAPNLQKLVEVNADQLKGLGSLIDELLNKSMQVSATVEKIFSGESGWFKKSGGILEIVDKLENAKQGAESTFAAVLVKTSDAQRKVSELQLNEAKITNKILGDIFRKMDAMSINAMPKTSAARPGALTIDDSLPLQFTSTNTRQQILQSGNSK